MIVTSFTTKVPSMIDDEHLRIDGEGTQPPTRPTIMGLCVYSCDLFEILADILVSFYSPKSGSNLVPPEKRHIMLTQVLDFNSRLDYFLAGVPKRLKVDRESVSPLQEEESSSLQREILHRRYVAYMKIKVPTDLCQLSLHQDSLDTTNTADQNDDGCQQRSNA